MNTVRKGCHPLKRIRSRNGTKFLNRFDSLGETRELKRIIVNLRSHVNAELGKTAYFQDQLPNQYYSTYLMLMKQFRKTRDQRGYFHYNG